MMTPPHIQSQNRNFEQELPDPERVSEIIHSLSIATGEPRKRWKGSVQKLVMEPEETFENELSQLSDVQSDRDLSLLPLIGVISTKKRDIERKVVDEEDEEDEEAGRFDDPVTEYPSTTASDDRSSSQDRWGIDASVPYISRFFPRSRSILLSNGVAPISSSPRSRRQQQNKSYTHFEEATDADDSDESFYSCPATPPRSEPSGRPIELETSGSTSPISSISTVRAVQRPCRVAYSRPDSNFTRQTSYFRSSLVTNNEKRPSLSGSPRPEPRGQRKFSSFKQQNTFKKQLQTSFDTNAICSAESSFNAPSSFSSKAEKDWSPPTSADTSFNEVEDVKFMSHQTRQDGLGKAWLAIVTEGATEMRLSEGSGNDTTDIDELEICYRHERSHILPRKPGGVPPGIQPTPSKRQSLPRNGRKKTSALKSNGRKSEQSQVEMRVADDDYEENAFQRLAEAFFGGEPELSLGSALSPGDMSTSKKQDISHLHQRAIEPNEDEKADAYAVPRVVETESLIDGGGSINNSQGPLAGAQEQLDDEDEFGTIDTSFENEFFGEFFYVGYFYMLSIL